MKKVIIVHGFRAKPNSSWKSWLLVQLRDIDIYAGALLMPTPEEPKSDEWVREIERYADNPDDEIYLVGHSLGCRAILAYLQKTSRKITAVFLVSGTSTALRVEEEDSPLRKIDNFFETHFDFGKIKNTCSQFYIIHAKDDNRVPFEHALFFEKNLEAQLVALETGGHLSGKDGVSELPILMDLLKPFFRE